MPCSQSLKFLDSRHRSTKLFFIYWNYIKAWIKRLHLQKLLATCYLYFLLRMTKFIE